MGGVGSGRRYQNAKDTTNNVRSLDVRRLQRDSLLTPGQSYGWNWTRDDETVASIQIMTEVGQIRLKYQHRSGGTEWQAREYPVALQWMDCNLGGQRAWFECPTTGCGRRVALLYITRSGVFACRHCHRLVYACQRETTDDRAGRRADRIRKRLGWEPGFLNGKGWKPKGMRWATYKRLENEHDEFVSAALAGLADRFGIR